MERPSLIARGFAYCIIALTALLAFRNSLNVPFLHDDKPAIAANTSIRNLWQLDKVLSPPQATTVNGRPVINLSLAVNYWIHQLGISGYHVFNIIVHIANGLLLFAIVLMTLSRITTEQFTKRSAIIFSLSISLLWVSHPLQTASVTYIIQRAEVIMGFFYLLTLFCMIRGCTAGRSLLWQASAVAACMLGMGSKEVMMSAPLAVLLYDRVFMCRSFKEIYQKRLALYLLLAATWLVLALSMKVSAQRSGSAGFGLGIHPVEYGLFQVQTIVGYLGLCFWPSPLIFDYGTSLQTDSLHLAWCGAVLMLLICATILSLWRMPWIGFLGICFFMLLAPSSSIIPVVTEPAAEHRMYLPLAVIVILAAGSLYRLCGYLCSRVVRQPFGRPVYGDLSYSIIMAGLVVLCGFLAFQRNQDYASALELWQDTVNKRPTNFRAQYNLGCELRRAGHIDAAIRALSTAISLNNNDSKAYNNRGILYNRTGNYHLAQQDFTAAIRLDPNCSPAYANRGSAYLYQQQHDLAVQDFTTAIALSPHQAELYCNRAAAHDNMKMYEHARTDMLMCQKLHGSPDPALIQLLKGATR